MKSDPVFTQIVDDSFFSNPIEISENDDLISIISSELDAAEDVKKREMLNEIQSNQISFGPQFSEDSQNVSQGSHPKWDDVARKAHDKKMKAKKEDEDRLRKEDEKMKKKAGKSWFTKNRKEAKDSQDDEINFVKRKEVEKDTTASSTLTSANTLSTTASSSNTLSSANTLSTTASSSNTLSSANTSSSANTLPTALRQQMDGTQMPRKKSLQRQKTLLNEDRPNDDASKTKQDDLPSSAHVNNPTPAFSFEKNKEEVSLSNSETSQTDDLADTKKEIAQKNEEKLVVPTSNSSDYVTATTLITESGSSQVVSSESVKSVLSDCEVEEDAHDIGMISALSDIFPFVLFIVYWIHTNMLVISISLAGYNK